MTPIHLIIARLKRMPLHQQIFHLRTLVAAEKPYSIRRNELESLLEGKVTRQIKRESRAA